MFQTPEKALRAISGVALVILSIAFLIAGGDAGELKYILIALAAFFSGMSLEQFRRNGK